jgi:hypothetical protein
MAIQKFADNISSESEGNAAVIFRPSLHVFIRVGPQQVTKKA